MNIRFSRFYSPLPFYVRPVLGFYNRQVCSIDSRLQSLRSHTLPEARDNEWYTSYGNLLASGFDTLENSANYLVGVAEGLANNRLVGGLVRRGLSKWVDFGVDEESGRYIIEPKNSESTMSEYIGSSFSALRSTQISKFSEYAKEQCKDFSIRAFNRALPVYELQERRTNIFADVGHYMLNLTRSFSFLQRS